MSDATASWSHGELPDNALIGAGTLITGEHAFKRFRADRPGALCIGPQCTMDGAHFAVEPGGRIEIGECCYFTNAILLAEELAAGWLTHRPRPDDSVGRDARGA